MKAIVNQFSNDYCKTAPANPRERSQFSKLPDLTCEHIGERELATAIPNSFLGVTFFEQRSWWMTGEVFETQECLKGVLFKKTIQGITKFKDRNPYFSLTCVFLLHPPRSM